MTTRSSSRVVHANLAWVALCRLEPSRALDHARTAVRVRGAVREPIPLRVALEALAQAESLLGRETWPTIHRAVSDRRRPRSRGNGAAGEDPRRQLLLGRKDRAGVGVIPEADHHLVESGLELMRHDTLPVLSEVECAAGEWARRSPPRGGRDTTSSSTRAWTRSAIRCCSRGRTSHP